MTRRTLIHLSASSSLILLSLSFALYITASAVWITAVPLLTAGLMTTAGGAAFVLINENANLMAAPGVASVEKVTTDSSEMPTPSAKVIPFSRQTDQDSQRQSSVDEERAS